MSAPVGTRFRTCGVVCREAKACLFRAAASSLPWTRRRGTLERANYTRSGVRTRAFHRSTRSNSSAPKAEGKRWQRVALLPHYCLAATTQRCFHKRLDRSRCKRETKVVRLLFGFLARCWFLRGYMLSLSRACKPVNLR